MEVTVCGQTTVGWFDHECIREAGHEGLHISARDFGWSDPTLPDSGEGDRG